MNINLSEINLELDNNSNLSIIYLVNEIIYLLSKRKQLMVAKKRKMRDDVEARLIEAKHSH